MKVVLLDGSPKTKNSTSAYLLKALEEKLADADIIWHNGRKPEVSKLESDISHADALVVAFPLYVDGIPAHLLQLLVTLEQRLAEISCKTKVSVIVNSGFYEARQNEIAIEMMKLWCMKSALRWGQGVAAGGGGMAQAAPVGQGPSANMGKALDELAAGVLTGEYGGTIYTEPNFPRFLYKTAVHFVWRRSAKANGLKLRDLYRSRVE